MNRNVDGAQRLMVLGKIGDGLRWVEKVGARALLRSYPSKLAPGRFLADLVLGRLAPGTRIPGYSGFTAAAR